ncbi:MAG: hypothetical protein QOF74_2077 [Caballeronia mineralivorans]|jgi:hypothetical protein|nr:hypothetical protein [Caballeronia mineralivorans]
MQVTIVTEALWDGVVAAHVEVAVQLDIGCGAYRRRSVTHRPTLFDGCIT